MPDALARQLRAVRRRWHVNVVLASLSEAVLIGAILAALAVVVERTFAAQMVSTATIVALAAGVAVLAGGLWWVRRPGALAVAAKIDRRLGLQERFSTALALADRDDPFARAAVADAHRVAQSLHAGKHFPVHRPRLAAAAGVACVATGLLAWLLPQWDVLGLLAARVEQQTEAQRIAQARASVKQAVQAISSTVQKLDDPSIAKDLAGLKGLDGQPQEAGLKRQAIRKLGDLSDKIRRMQARPGMQSADQMRHMLRRLRPSRTAYDNELNRSLSAGDAAAVAQRIRDLHKKLLSQDDRKAGSDPQDPPKASDAMTDEQKADLAKQLDDLARQAKELANVDEAVRRVLKDAGLNEQEARDATAEGKDLREALKERGLSDEQIDKLIEKLDAARRACEEMDKLAEALARCSDKEGEAGEDGEPIDLDKLARLAEQLDDLEGMLERLKLAEASLNEIDRAVAALGSKMAKDGKPLLASGAPGQKPDGPPNSGSGMGRGRGAGKRPTDDSGKTGVKNVRSPSKKGQGPIIASWYFKGRQIKGESKKAYGQAVQAAQDRAADAVKDRQIPREYENAVKRYFGDLKKAGESK